MTSFPLQALDQHIAVIGKTGSGKTFLAKHLVETLLKKYPAWQTKQQIAEAIGMTASGGSFNTYLSRISAVGLIEKSERGIRLSNEVMG